MSNLLEHAEAELARTGIGDEDADYGGAIAGAVLDIVRTFSAQGHSGGSAMLTIALVERLLRYEPLTPLTGEADEWIDRRDIGSGPELVAQNRRCSRVMLREDGSAYDVLDGEIVEITFPYTPPREGA